MKKIGNRKTNARKMSKAANKEKIMKHEKEMPLAIAKMQKILRKIPDDEITRAVRDSKDQR